MTGAGVARTYYLWELAHQTDASWIGFDLYAVSVAECQLGIICCCLPFLRVFFRRIFLTAKPERDQLISAVSDMLRDPQMEVRTTASTTRG